MRPGEVLALRPCDITDAPQGMVAHVRGTVVRRQGTRDFRQDQAKTDASRRSIAVPDLAAQVRRRRIAEMAGDLVRDGRSRGPDHPRARRSVAIRARHRPGGAPARSVERQGARRGRGIAGTTEHRIQPAQPPANRSRPAVAPPTSATRWPPASRVTCQSSARRPKGSTLRTTRTMATGAARSGRRRRRSSRVACAPRGIPNSRMRCALASALCACVGIRRASTHAPGRASEIAPTREPPRST